MASRAVGILTIVPLVFLAGACNRQPRTLETIKDHAMTSERVEFNTADGIKLIGDYYASAKDSGRGIVLVHMMPATRASWAEFAPKLALAGYQTLALDLRGHGQSDGGDYQMFTDAQHQKSILDLEAAADFLRSYGAKQLVFIGASIGANLSLQYLAEHSASAGVVLLSPGLDYRGIELSPLLAKIPDKGKILLVGAEDDLASTGIGCAALAANFKLPEQVCYPAGGHGTNLFISHPELGQAILKFLERRF